MPAMTDDVLGDAVSVPLHSYKISDNFVLQRLMST
jgi:hypothetical protein